MEYYKKGGMEEAYILYDSIHYPIRATNKVANGKARRNNALPFIDEAQYLSSAVLKDVKMILNQGYDSLNCFTLILCGEPYLDSTLEKPMHEALRQSITVHYNFSGLNDFEVADYILHKLSVAGGGKKLIEDTAISDIHGYCHGNPRLIDNIMTDALTLGAHMDKPVIDSDVILAAVKAQALF